MYLIDTNIFVFALRGDERIASRLLRNKDKPLSLSVITFGELLYGAMKSSRPDENVARVRRIAELYPVIDLSPPIMDRFAALRVELEHSGQKLDDFDLLIAATALTMGCTLISSNLRHFGRIPRLVVEDWTEG